MYWGTSPYLTYITVLSAACPFVCALKHSLTHVFWRHSKAHVVGSVHVAVMCVMKCLVCRITWRYALTDIVINVHSSVLWAINHLLIRVKWIQWFIDIWIVHISGICVLKILVCFMCVIDSVQIWHLQYQIFCMEGTYYWSPQCHYFLLWNLKFLKFILQFFIF